jgi:hypothetical protein
VIVGIIWIGALEDPAEQAEERPHYDNDADDHANNQFTHD